MSVNIRIEANIVDPDQTAPTEAVWSWYTLFVFDDNITYILWLCALRVNKCEFSVYMVRNFIKMHARLRGQNNLLILHQVINRT